MATIATGVDETGCGLVAAADVPVVRSALDAAAGCHERHLSTPAPGAVYRGVWQALGAVS